eukprot:6203150-Pleurochrysis_carterae.AAC.1
MGHETLGTSGGRKSSESRTRGWTAGLARGDGGGEGGRRRKGGGDGWVGDEGCGGDVGGDGGVSVRSISARSSPPADTGDDAEPGMKLRAIPSHGGRRSDALSSCGASGKGWDMKRCASRAGGGNKATRMPRSTA